MHPCRVGDIRWPGQKRRAVGHKRQHVINRRLRVLPTCLEWLRLSRRARDTTAARLHHSRHRGESATKTIKFFVAHTVNHVICNNHTRIDWVLLNFTPVTQQNYHQLGRKFEKLFCAVDRLSCQLELSKSETSQFRSDLVFDIVNYVHIMWDLPPSGDVAPHVTSVCSPSLAQSWVWCRHPRGKPCYALTW